MNALLHSMFHCSGLSLLFEGYVSLSKTEKAIQILLTLKPKKRFRKTMMKKGIITFLNIILLWFRS